MNSIALAHKNREFLRYIYNIARPRLFGGETVALNEILRRGRRPVSKLLLMSGLVYDPEKRAQ